MKKCKSCQKEIDIKAKKCPYCQTDQRIWFARHPIVTVFLVGFTYLCLNLGTKVNNLENISDRETANQTTTNSTTSPTANPTVKPTDKPTTAPTLAPQTGNQNISPISSETISQKNAVNKAKSYLGYSAFSHDGLVAQLEYEQFFHSDAVYGADNSGANWNEQAAKKAKQYMEYSAFSRGSLIEQLKYDKFTQEQAEYGANAVGI